MVTDASLRLDEQICFPLYAATRAMMHVYQPMLAKLGLTYPQYVVMLVVWETEGLSVKQIGDRLYLDSGTLTPLLKRLETAGFVVRERSTEDERVVNIRVTVEGKRLQKRAADVPRTLACRLGKSPTEMLRLRAELRDLYAHLRALAFTDDDDAAARHC
jgi:MarR family transcriptional regulator, organic hydroperoxide resistance regulator